MLILSLTIIVVCLLCTLFVYIQFFGYPIFMANFLTTKENKNGKDYNHQPYISIIIPTYNEEKTIAKRIDNLLSQNYPSDKIEILIVDSGSKDNTLTIGKEYEKQYANVKIIEEDTRRGKASAINLGKKFANSEIVFVTDANDIFNNDAIKEMAKHFNNPKVGAVGGRFVLTNSENSLVSSSSFYWDIESLMRRGESNFDSACLFHGEINAWRKDIVSADSHALSEDLDMAVQIRKQGYKIIYEPSAIAYEPGPTSENEQIIQKKRTTIGTIQCFFKHKKYLWFPHDRYSGIIFPFHKEVQIFSPFFILGVIITIVSLLLLQQFTFIVIYLLAVGVLFLVSFIILSKILFDAKISTQSKKTTFPIKKLIDILYYVILHEFIILLAWKDYFTGKYTVTWKQATTTRL
jgi:poly-beta-1,6-N-acetyl-D-glucosamine synthase